MKGGKKSTINTGSFNIKVYGYGLIRGYMVSILLFFMGAILITYTSLSEGIIPFITSTIMIIGIVFSAVYCSAHLQKKGWLHGAVIGFIYILILILLSKIFITDYSIDRTAMYKIILGVGTGVVGGMLGVNLR